MNAVCLDEAVVVAFLEGGLSESDRSQVERHVAACTACADLMTLRGGDQAHPSRTVGSAGRPFVGQLHPGSRVDRYQILGAVGRGGMGEVYAAYHPDLDRRIALKVVHQTGAESVERRARLLRGSAGDRATVAPTSSRCTTRARSTIASTSPWNSSTGRLSMPGSVRGRGVGEKSWTSSSRRAVASQRPTQPASFTATSNPRTS